jgi:DNA recombination protein RmuC
MSQLTNFLMGLHLADWLLLVTVFLLLVIVILLVILVGRKGPDDLATSLSLQGELLARGQERLEKVVREEIAQNREESLSSSRHNREETSATLHTFATGIQSLITGMRDTIETGLRVIQTENSKKLDQMREENSSTGRQQREELGHSLKSFNDSVLKGMTDMGRLLKEQMESFSQQLQQLMAANTQQQETLRQVVATRLQQMQEDNTKRLDQMRATVDEKLQGTLEKRLGESFKHVSERLEQVHKGLGEMKNLATGVGDLKRVLTNVKSRGGWGEIQLEALLEHILAPEQFARNVKIGDVSGEVVEFALRLPGRGDGEVVWLPIDAKFPLEDYERLVEAQERADTEAMELAAKNLTLCIKTAARNISDKYVVPPKTTDFAIMFLPNEGLYAEVIRRPGLVETLQRDYRVVIAGPTTCAALLNSLQMGFRTLAIQKRSSEVWQLLGAVKTDFGKFGDILAGVKKKLEQASQTMDDAARRSRAIERKLRVVQELPADEAGVLLSDASVDLEVP